MRPFTEPDRSRRLLEQERESTTFLGKCALTIPLFRFTSIHAGPTWSTCLQLPRFHHFGGTGVMLPFDLSPPQ